MSRSSTSRVQRALRRLTLGSGPLRRTSDRLEVAGRLLVLLSLLAAVPLAVLLAGVVRGHMAAAAAAHSAGAHEERAVVLAGPATTTAPTTPEATAATDLVRTEVRWSAPDGSARHAAVVVQASTAVGSTVPVWVDRSGNLSAPPPDPATLSAEAFAIGAGIAVGIPLVAWGLHRGLRLALDLSRTRRWGREWERVDREWDARQK